MLTQAHDTMSCYSLPNLGTMGRECTAQEACCSGLFLHFYACLLNFKACSRPPICLIHQKLSPCLLSALPAKFLSKGYQTRDPTVVLSEPASRLPWVLQLEPAYLSPQLQYHLFAGLPAPDPPPTPHPRSLQPTDLIKPPIYNLCIEVHIPYGQADPLSTERQTLELYLHIFYISFIFISIHEYVLHLELTFLEHLLCAESPCVCPINSDSHPNNPGISPPF